MCRNLELSAIRTLNDFGLTGIRRPPFTGIWIGDKKIAAIGVAVRRCITFHGLALNVNTDLAYFKRIIPCGLAWADVTSMAKELGTEHRAWSLFEIGFSTTLRKFSTIHISERIEDWRIENRESPSSII